MGIFCFPARIPAFCPRSSKNDKLTKQKKFGLVFEEHLPERTPLYELPIKKGSLVALKAGEINKVYTVISVGDGKAACINRDEGVSETFELDDLVCVAEFGELIYPYLKPIDSVCYAPNNSLWHTLIQADNYHALQLLQYLYAGKVYCIYIDPPYNTGARDWKYNNDYVDGSDAYRHSKWLSFMEKRLKIAKKLLNPKDSVLIVTIDEKEYLHLGCLLEEIFPDARIQMVNIIINKNGVSRTNAFKRSEEYAFFIMMGDAAPAELETATYSPFIDDSKKSSSDEELQRDNSESDGTFFSPSFYKAMSYLHNNKDGKLLLVAASGLILVHNQWDDMACSKLRIIKELSPKDIERIDMEMNNPRGFWNEYSWGSYDDEFDDEIWQRG